MSENCPQTHRCKANAPGWLEGSHPTVEQGEVTRKVCFTWNGTCCSWSSNILVLNCGKFYVYKLVPPDSYQSRYCGDHGKWASPHARQSRSVLDSGLHAMDSGFQVLDSGFQLLVGFWTPWAVVRIPNPRIPDSHTWGDELIGLAGKAGRALKLGFSQRCLQYHFSTYSQV